MADKPNASPADSAVGAGSAAAKPASASSGQNPAFRAMGLPRLRLPSRNWLIFLSITGSIAGAITYDKWQTRRVKEKWANLVSHIADEPLSVRSMPRKLTIYLAAPPGDGLRSAREHFHDYIKPVLVAAAMDWDVVEGRREGDVRYKTAERIRRKRKRAGEGAPLTEEEESKYAIEAMREKTGTTEYDGLTGDLVVGRHAWKEYIRGMHEGWLGPADAPPLPEAEGQNDPELQSHTPGHSSASDAAVKAAVKTVEANTETSSTGEPLSGEAHDQDTDKSSEVKPAVTEEKKEEEEKPKPRNPPPYITPAEYQTAHLSPSTPEILGPSAAIRFPHILGFRNTPIRIYRFLTRRRLADDIGRQVACAVLATYNRPFSTVSVTDEDSASSAEKNVPEQTRVLAHEEKDWWKTVRVPRKEHEESVWIEDVVMDERLASRMRMFELAGEDEERAKRIAEGKGVPGGKSDEES